MDAEKNLHAFIPQALLTRAQQAAQRENITLDDLVSDAMNRRLDHDGFENVLAFGRRQAEVRNLKPADVTGAIADARRQQRN